jgi:hypothetical protein
MIELGVASARRAWCPSKQEVLHVIANLGSFSRII